MIWKIMSSNRLTRFFSRMQTLNRISFIMLDLVHFAQYSFNQYTNFIWIYNLSAVIVLTHTVVSRMYSWKGQIKTPLASFIDIFIFHYAKDISTFLTKVWKLWSWKWKYEEDITSCIPLYYERTVLHFNLPIPTAFRNVIDI